LLAGYYYLISPYSRYRLSLPEGGSVLVFYFGLMDIELENIIRSIPPVGACTTADLYGLEQWIPLAEQEREEPHPLTRYRIDSGVKSALLSLAYSAWQGVMEGLEPQEGEERHSRVSFPMAEYIRKHYSDKVTLNDMAKQFGFHPHYIIKMFNQRVGMSPIQYLQEIRLLKAMEFLEQTNMTVTEISESIGLTTSYFSRLFHERKGESPSQYRKKREKKYSMKTS
jgi:AraC-like DNA-binding protein